MKLQEEIVGTPIVGERSSLWCMMGNKRCVHYNKLAFWCGHSYRELPLGGRAPHWCELAFDALFPKVGANETG